MKRTALVATVQVAQLCRRHVVHPPVDTQLAALVPRSADNVRLCDGLDRVADVLVRQLGERERVERGARRGGAGGELGRGEGLDLRAREGPQGAESSAGDCVGVEGEGSTHGCDPLGDGVGHRARLGHRLLLALGLLLGRVDSSLHAGPDTAAARVTCVCVLRSATVSPGRRLAPCRPAPGRARAWSRVRLTADDDGLDLKDVHSVGERGRGRQVALVEALGDVALQCGGGRATKEEGQPPRVRAASVRKRRTWTKMEPGATPVALQ